MVLLLLFSVPARRLLATEAKDLLPDLTIRGLAMTPDPAVLGQSATIEFDLVNLGTAGIVGVMFFVDVSLQGDLCRRFEESFSLAAGTLRTFRTTACVPVEPGCYDVVVEADPQGVVLESDETNNRATARFCWGEPDGYCGDGVRNGDEVCDGQDFGGLTCVGLGYAGGALVCTERCTLDTSGCTALPTCGDGVRTGDELCDGDDFGVATCASLPQFHGGTLSCTEDCTFDTSGCDFCGDGVRNGPEECDGEDLGGVSCIELGHYGGVLSCAGDCRFDTSLCQFCGDGVRNGEEDCDGRDLDGSTCQSLDLGFDGGVLGCTADCTFDTSQCEICGDGVRTGREECDNRDLGGRTCRTLGYEGGVLSCRDDCTLDISGCIGADDERPPWLIGDTFTKDVNGEGPPGDGGAGNGPRGGCAGVSAAGGAGRPWMAVLLFAVALATLALRRRARRRRPREALLP